MVRLAQLNLLLFDTGMFDHSVLRSYLDPHYGQGIELETARSLAELNAFLERDCPADVILLGSVPDDVELARVVRRITSALPMALIVVITDRQVNSPGSTGIDPTRVSVLPSHQLGRLPFMLANWTERSSRQRHTFEVLPPVPGADEGLYRIISSLTADYLYVVEFGQDGADPRYFRSDALCEMTGYSHEEIDEMGSVGLIHPEDLDLFHSRRAALFAGEPRVDEFRLLTRTGKIRWIRDYARPIMRPDGSYPIRIVGAAQEITNEKLLQSRLSAQASILEMIARGEHTRTVLTTLNEIIEDQIPDALCSIQLVDRDGNVLRPEVAHRLPQGYLDAIWTVPIAPDHGCCGEAAFTRSLSISSDVQSDARFERYRDLMARYSLESVWSTPIFDPEGEVVGVFALYFRTNRTPLDHELALLDSAAQIAGIALDVGHRDSQRQMAQMRYQTLIEQAPSITLMSDAADPCDIIYLSPQFDAFSDTPASEILRRPERVRSFVHPEDRRAFNTAVERSRKTGAPLEIEFRIQRRDGSSAWVQARISLLRDQNGDPLHWLGVMLDVTDRNEAIRQRAESERRYRSLFDDNLNSIVIYDYEGRVIDLNPATVSMSGYSAEELKGYDLLWMVAPEDRERAERYFLQARAGISSQFTLTVINKQGERREISASQGPVVVDGEIVGVSSISEDITERRRLESQLLYQAYHDSLTGLPNRIYFDQTLANAIETLGRYSELAVLFLDLNNFKIINDSLGHDIGDRFLVSIARRLRDVLPREAMVARFGGDEFTVLLPSVPDAKRASAEVSEQIITEMATPVTIDGYQLGTNVSIGIASVTMDSLCEPGELTRRADIALYDAKRGGHESSYRMFDEGMDEWVFERLWIEADLRRALVNEEFVVHFQPVLDLNVGDATVVEALLRWNHPKRGLLMPEVFLDIAEETGSLLDIDQWVLETAARQIVEWNARNPDRIPLMLGVNVSPREFWHSGFVERILATLEKTGLDPSLLCIEITENTMMRDTDQAARRAQQLREHGILVAIDDFGTGYSSLSYLREFPIDVLKIDQAFISTLAEDDQQLGLVQAIISMARALHLVVVAEGIETEEQLQLVRDLNCEFVQGYLIAYPDTFERIGGLLEQRAHPTVI